MQKQELIEKIDLDEKVLKPDKIGLLQIKGTDQNGSPLNDSAEFDRPERLKEILDDYLQTLRQNNSQFLGFETVKTAKLIVLEPTFINTDIKKCLTVGDKFKSNYVELYRYFYPIFRDWYITQMYLLLKMGCRETFQKYASELNNLNLALDDKTIQYIALPDNLGTKINQNLEILRFFGDKNTTNGNSNISSIILFESLPIEFTVSGVDEVAIKEKYIRINQGDLNHLIAKIRFLESNIEDEKIALKKLNQQFIAVLKRIFFEANLSQDEVKINELRQQIQDLESENSILDKTIKKNIYTVKYSTEIGLRQNALISNQIRLNNLKINQKAQEIQHLQKISNPKYQKELKEDLKSEIVKIHDKIYSKVLKTDIQGFEFGKKPVSGTSLYEYLQKSGRKYDMIGLAKKDFHTFILEFIIHTNHEIDENIAIEIINILENATLTPKVPNHEMNLDLAAYRKDTMNRVKIAHRIMEEEDAQNRKFGQFTNIFQPISKKHYKNSSTGYSYENIAPISRQEILRVSPNIKRLNTNLLVLNEHFNLTNAYPDSLDTEIEYLHPKTKAQIIEIGFDSKLKLSLDGSSNIPIPKGENQAVVGFVCNDPHSTLTCVYSSDSQLISIRTENQSPIELEIYFKNTETLQEKPKNFNNPNFPWFKPESVQNKPDFKKVSWEDLGVPLDHPIHKKLQELEKNSLNLSTIQIIKEVFKILKSLKLSYKYNNASMIGDFITDVQSSMDAFLKSKSGICNDSERVMHAILSKLGLEVYGQECIIPNKKGICLNTDLHIDLSVFDTEDDTWINIETTLIYDRFSLESYATRFKQRFPALEFPKILSKTKKPNQQIKNTIPATYIIERKTSINDLLKIAMFNESHKQIFDLLHHIFSDYLYGKSQLELENSHENNQLIQFLSSTRKKIDDFNFTITNKKLDTVDKESGSQNRNHETIQKIINSADFKNRQDFILKYLACFNSNENNIFTKAVKTVTKLLISPNTMLIAKDQKELLKNLITQYKNLI